MIYVGSGEGLQRPDLSTGDGIYKSTDAGKTWMHLGLRDAQQIAAIVVDPKDPNRVFVAALGHPYGPNTERGVFRSTDGGQTSKRCLYKDENTGAVALAFDPSNSRTMYAVLWAARRRPGKFAAANVQRHQRQRFVQVDRRRRRPGSAHQGVADRRRGLGRIGIAVRAASRIACTPTSNRRKKPASIAPTMRAQLATGQLRPPHLGPRHRRRHEHRIDPDNPNRRLRRQHFSWKSTDGAQKFCMGFKGAPGGDDYHAIWINPENPHIMLLAADQGAVISVNGGETWSSWYNQPTAQFYHVITDNRFPYWVYGGAAGERLRRHR